MNHAELSRIRRTLHRHAEPAFLEFHTAWVIERELAGLPLAIRRGNDAIDLSGVVDLPDEEERAPWTRRAAAAGVSRERLEAYSHDGTALVAEISGRRPGPVIALRSDMDALMIDESTGDSHSPHRERFRSVTPAMHACGHDAHVAIGIGLLHRLAADTDFPGTVRVLFQPAEEGVRGAQAMIAAGVLDGVQDMIGVHVLGHEPVGLVVGSTKGGMAAQKLAVSFAGRAAHASVSPEEGRNALMAAVAATSAMMSIPRFGYADTRVNVGTFHAGSAANIVPDSAEITCDLRASDDITLDELVRRVRVIVRAAADAQEVHHAVRVTGAACTLQPDDDLISEILAAAERTEGFDTFVPTAHQPGSDDVHLMMRDVQRMGGRAAYINVGAASPGPHHSATFDLDERVMVQTVDLLERWIRSPDR